MFKLTKLISLWPDTSAADRKSFEEALRAASRADPRIRRAMLQPTLARSAHAGGYIWHLQFASENDYRWVTNSNAWRLDVERRLATGPVFCVDSAAYHPGRSAAPEPGLEHGVYRTLLVAIRPATPVEQIQRFEDEMCGMPHYIRAIRNWSFSRVAEAGGARGWTHVWEQDYRTLGDLQGPYTMHPYHWALIDRWYNCECPDWIVDDTMRHAFCAFDDSMFAPLP